MSFMAQHAHGKTASKFAVALLGCTVLAGLPVAALAQEPAVQQTPAPAAPAEQGEVIRSITVVGSQRLEPETIRSYIQLREGQVYTAARADQALIDLAATELFADYRITHSSGNVTITVEENPIINRVLLEGNRRIKDDKLREEINLSPRQIFTRSRVRADVARIIELYKRQGRYAATVEPQMVMLDQNRVDVIFEITEGPKSKVRQINIIGNEAFSDGRLRGEMVTKESGLLKIFSSNTSYDPDRLQYDQQLLRQFYLTEGYADFRVVSAVAELTPDKRDFIITYVLEEGERYRFGNVEVVSQLRDFDSDRLTQSIRIQEGDWYNAELVDNTIEQLTDTAGTFGYAFAQVRPQFVPNRENRTMDVRFTLSDAPRVYVESIEINGNTITQDKVVRREFRLVEGDAFSSLQVARTTARINSLGYFQENFEVEQVEGSAPDRIVLQANLQERPTGELTLSAGFSSLESFIFQGSIRQNNFRGRGQSVGLSLNYSRYSRSGSISFTEPYLFDRNISAGVDIYRQDYNNGFFNRQSATYEQSTTGIAFRAGVPLTEYLSLIGRYTLNIEDVTIDENQFFADFDGDGVRQCEPLLAGRYLCDAIGNRVNSILGLSLVHDTLNNRRRPTSGSVLSASVDFAGLGGSTRYLRARLNGSKFFDLGSNFIFSLRAEGGAISGIGDEVRLTDRFQLGEPDIRGFDIRGIGPRVIRRLYERDADGVQVLLPIDDERNPNDALGGRFYYFGRAELEIPLGSGAREMGLRPSLFADIGSVWGVRRPQLINSPLPDGLFVPQLNGEGQQLYSQLNDSTLTGTPPTCTGTVVQVTNPVNPNPGCLESATNNPLGLRLQPFVEEFYGNTPKPRLTVGVGVNWNSPFGPFRIDLAYDVLSQPGDETKTLSFNVGTSF
ncbi:outer membrane protein assembly factor BamA [Altererythrobacter sp. KTW20L]|uniref:outer membrane protein assembly factor BamA n=1 Tax=Altererythrobacter sp. KTW20L TaxID=2942210 RepID=UPI0020BE5E16|nr:outer membrane protein assembly factor BamA [Altererythrobacter sp. KTW20L]MCL6251251.1 outer membrane protein assembly factor BamA [Altererythrobacter sp. KTW20L]